METTLVKPFRIIDTVQLGSGLMQYKVIVSYGTTKLFKAYSVEELYNKICLYWSHVVKLPNTKGRYSILRSKFDGVALYPRIGNEPIISRHI